MNLGLRFNTIAVLTVLLGLLTFCLADERPGLAMVSAAVCLAGYFAGKANGGWRPTCLPRVVVNLLVLAAIINAAFHASRASAGQPIVSHLGEFLVYVQLLKLFDRRTSRDESQLLTLSVFLIIAAMLTSNALPVGLGLLIYTPLAITACMLYQLRSGQRRAAGDPAPAPITAATPPLSVAPARLYQGRRSRPQFRLVAASSLMLATVLAGAIFAITPRGMGVNTLGRFGEARITRTGFNDQITLGASGFLQDSPVPVLDLAVEDASGGSLGSPDRIFYLRGVTRDQYGGRIWTSSSRTTAPGRGALQIGPGAAATLAPGTASEPPRGTRIVQRITLRAPARENSVLFTVWRPHSLSAAQNISVDVDRDDLSIRRNSSAPSELTYVVQSSQADTGGRDEPEPVEAFTEGRIRDLAVSLLQQARVSINPDERDRAANRLAAAALRDYLQANCVYSRELIKPAEQQDPIEMFLFETRQGHCEYFASAMVAMCQSVGLPARLVVGYVAADFNTVTRKYLVRQSDAHAWVEVHVGGGSWQTFDPTPSEGVVALQRQSSGWFATVRNWYDTLEFGWNRSVIGFDAASQQNSSVGRRINFERLGRFLDDVSGRMFVTAAKARTPSGRRSLTSAILPAALVVAAGATLLVILRRQSRRTRRTARPRARRQGPGRRAATQVPFYRAALRTLRKGGIAKPEALPPLAHAARLADRRHPASGPLAALTAHYYKLRFGDTPLSGAELAAAQAHLDALKTSAAAARRRRV